MDGGSHLRAAHRALLIKHRRIVEDAALRRSSDSQLLQMADICAYAAFQSLQGKRNPAFASRYETLLDRLMQRPFGVDGGGASGASTTQPTSPTARASGSPAALKHKPRSPRACLRSDCRLTCAGVQPTNNVAALGVALNAVVKLECAMTAPTTSVTRSLPLTLDGRPPRSSRGSLRAPARPRTAPAARFRRAAGSAPPAWAAPRTGSRCWCSPTRPAARSRRSPRR